MIDKWLRDYLEACGRWNSDRVSRRASSAICRDCHRVMLVGLCADRCAWIAAVDPAPLSAQGEMIAHLLDLQTYSLRWMIHGLELDSRSPWAIQLSPAPDPDRPGSRLTYDVVAEHRCSVQALPGVPSVHAPRAVDYNGDPPF